MNRISDVKAYVVSILKFYYLTPSRYDVRTYGYNKESGVTIRSILVSGDFI